MKKNIFSIIAILLILPLTGCVNFIPELSEDEYIKSVRYMADAVLEHDVNYKSRLLNEEEKQEALAQEAAKEERLQKIEEQEQKQKEEKEKENTPDEVTTTTAVKKYTADDINDYLGIDGAEFEYAGEEVVNKYPQNDDSLGFAFTSTDGNKLVIVKFNLKNVSGEDVYVNLASANPKFKAIINESQKFSASKVPLEYVLNFYENTLNPGDIDQLVLIYEIPEDLSVDKLELSLSALSKESIRISLE